MRWYTSDPHFYHTNVIKYCDRPFATVEEMNEDIVRRINEVVKPEDELYLLGDLAMAHRAVTLFIPRLNGTKHLIAGNHDHVHPVHHKNKEQKRQNAYKIYYDAGIKSIKLEDKHIIAGKEVVLHHMPYKAQEPGEHGEKYADYRPADNGLWLLHGHVHEKWKQRGRMINVGVDVWNFYPVSEETVAATIAEGEKNVGKIFDDRLGILHDSGDPEA